MNINFAINQGSKILKNKLIPNSLLDSEILMAKTLNKDRKFILLNSSCFIEKNNLNKFYKLIKLRSLGNPIAHLTKKKFFWNSEFFVTNDALIPRPDTELAVEIILSLTKFKNKIRLLDIGIGSGCILLSILKERPNFYGVGIDISNKSIKVSKYNAKMLQLKNKVKFYHSDVDNFKIGKYDLIVSNPPYINFPVLKYLDKDVVNFEPKIALDGGFDGISKIRKVINRAAVLIKKNGKLVLEIGFNQKNRVLSILKNEGFYTNKIVKDYGKKDRCVISTKI